MIHVCIASIVGKGVLEFVAYGVALIELGSLWVSTASFTFFLSLTIVLSLHNVMVG